MIRPPQASTSPSSPPSLRLSLSGLPSSHLLPSERLALSSSTLASPTPSQLPHSNSSPSLSTLPSTIATPPLSRLPSSASRNDLFAHNWSPISPNTLNPVPPPPLVAAPTPPPPPPPRSTLPPQTSSPGSIKSKYSIDIPIPPPEIKFDLPPTPPQVDRVKLPPISTAGNGIFGAPIASVVPAPPQPKLVSTIANTPPSTAAQAGISDNPVLDSRQGPRLRLVPTNDFILGEGRHATVFLSSFVPKPSSSSHSAFNDEKTISHPFYDIKESEWKLCAAKRVLPDRESQLAGLGEAFVLSRLATGSSLNRAVGTGSRYIVSLYGVKDERDGYEGVEGTEGEDKDSLKRKRWDEARQHHGGAGGGRHSGDLTLAGTSLAHSYLHHPHRTTSLSASQPPSTTNPNLSIQTHQLRTASDATQPYSAVLPKTRHGALQQHELMPRRQSSLHHSQTRHLSPIASPSRDDDEVQKEEEDEDEGDVWAVDRDDETNDESLDFEELARERRGPRYSEPGTMTPEEGGSPSRRELMRRGQTMQVASSSHSHSASTTSASAPSANSPPRIILLLEYCPFGHVMAFIKSYPERMGKQRWIAWAKQLTIALCWAHEKGVLHADIKPQNVLIASDLSLRLSDFGMAMFVPPPGSSAPPPTDPLGLGTPPYSPPEFVRQPPSPFSFPSDIFSLGVTLSVMLTAREPYEGLRAVERMFHVQRGGYYEWDERRRLGIIGTGSTAGSRPVSRQGSIKSIRSSRSRASSNAGSLANGGIGARARSDSIESVKSLALTMPFNDDGGEWRERPSYATAELAMKLLATSHEEGEPTTPIPTTPSPTTQLAFTLPPSPISHTPAEPAQAAPHSSAETQDSSAVDDDFGAPLPTLYPDGSPVQYFLDGEELVPLRVKELIKSMTLPSAKDRPTAHQVLAILSELE